MLLTLEELSHCWPSLFLRISHTEDEDQIVVDLGLLAITSVVCVKWHQRPRVSLTTMGQGRLSVLTRFIRRPLFATLAFWSEDVDKNLMDVVLLLYAALWLVPRLPGSAVPEIRRHFPPRLLVLDCSRCDDWIHLPLQFPVHSHHHVLGT